MSVSALVARGIGFGGVAYVPTHGLGVGPATPPIPSPSVLVLDAVYENPVILDAVYENTVILEGCTVPAVEADIAIPADDKTLKLRVYSDAQRSARQDITGWTFRLTVHDGNNNVLFSRQGSDFSITDAANGEATCAISSSDAIGMVRRNPYYYYFRRDDTGNQNTLRFGRWTYLYT